MAIRLGSGVSVLNSEIKKIPIILVMCWVISFALLPILLIIGISFLQTDSHSLVRMIPSVSAYQQFFTPIFLKIVWHSLVFSAVCTLITLLLGYPTAYFLSCVEARYKNTLLLLLMIPFWTSSLIRAYAILAILKTQGLLNTFLLHLHLIHHPIFILYSNTATLIGMSYNLLPFMILPLLSNFEKLDPRWFEVSKDLGASKWRIFQSITIPLTLPGMMAGTLFVFLPAMTLFYIPDLLGGAKTIFMGNLVENQFLLMNDWPGGSATSVVLTLILGLLLLGYKKMMRRLHAQDIL